VECKPPTKTAPLGLCLPNPKARLREQVREGGRFQHLSEATEASSVAQRFPGLRRGRFLTIVAPMKKRSPIGQYSLWWRAFPWLPLLVGLFAAGGCATRVPNAPLAQRHADQGYYFHTKQRPNNSDETVFIVMFSGGGTRAAAFAYGVLDGLRRVEVDGPGGRRNLLNEVDAISSVSGGSVTAAAYGLHGEAIFPMLEGAFLKRNIQGALALGVLNPLNWPRLWSGHFGRSDLAAEYYDRILFQGATFAELQRRPGPFIVINSTDISTGARFEFTQRQFDLMCSDLATFPVSKAVAASSAVPGLLTPVTLNNYAGHCGYPIPEWITHTNAPQDIRGRLRTGELKTYLDSTNRPFLHVVDGGVSDNLGIRAVIDGTYALRNQPELQDGIDVRRVKRVVLLSVNAYSSPPKDWDQHESPPGSLTTAAAAAALTLDRYSIETLAVANEEFERWKHDLGNNGAAGVEFYPIFLSFRNFKEDKQRNFFLSMPTSFFLPPASVDELGRAGRELLNEDEVYQKLLRDLGARPVAK
jgi:NTE family protein